MFSVLFSNGLELQFTYDGQRGGYYCEHNGGLHKLAIDSSDDRLVYVGRLIHDGDAHYFLSDKDMIPMRVDCENGWKMINESYAALKSIDIVGMHKGDGSGTFTFKL